MTHVPADEPYAMGQTLTDAAIFTVLPRFLFPNKREGASTQLFLRFTGIKLPPNTRMGLGVIGELYANFGMVGLILLFFADRAQKNPLWWAVAPAILLPCVEPGFNIEDVSNHIVKGSV